MLKCNILLINEVIGTYMYIINIYYIYIYIYIHIYFFSLLGKILDQYFYFFLHFSSLVSLRFVIYCAISQVKICQNLIPSSRVWPYLSDEYCATPSPKEVWVIGHSYVSQLESKSLFADREEYQFTYWQQGVVPLLLTGSTISKTSSATRPITILLSFQLSQGATTSSLEWGRGR